ncbi:hypothetical protein [Tumebacillus permanentifrigoris]|uniref:Uncharacterized protein n=1 Tax=Tumebacillus permanentifrigoris TaxID=378543 RepID=A0A316DRQ4_9BACL|nr:hypothetical protein [Tumebacillus permanentifrigoris]PWK07499.1 hypothetical protein C7459_11798 [Tumebacillus permanentifrigoris]
MERRNNLVQLRFVGDSERESFAVRFKPGEVVAVTPERAKELEPFTEKVTHTKQNAEEVVTRNE